MYPSSINNEIYSITQQFHKYAFYKEKEKLCFRLTERKAARYAANAECPDGNDTLKQKAHHTIFIFVIGNFEV